MRLLKKLRVGLSHLRENKFRHSFQDWLGPVSNGSRIIEITTYFFLHCLDIANQRKSSSAKSQVLSALYWNRVTLSLLKYFFSNRTLTVTDKFAIFHWKDSIRCLLSFFFLSVFFYYLLVCLVLFVLYLCRSDYTIKLVLYLCRSDYTIKLTLNVMIIFSINIF